MGKGLTKPKRASKLKKLTSRSFEPLKKEQRMYRISVTYADHQERTYSYVESDTTLKEITNIAWAMSDEGSVYSVSLTLDNVFIQKWVGLDFRGENDY